MKNTITLACLALVLINPQALHAQANQDPKPAAIKPDASQLKGAGELLAQSSETADDATSVKVIVQKKQTIEEYRQRGELVLVKVIPNDGVPYFIDPLEQQKNHGSGQDLINSGVKPVRWVIKEF